MAESKRLERCPSCGRKQHRSNPQNRYYWLLLHMISEQIRPKDGQYSADQWHHYFKSRFLGCDDMKLPNGKTLILPKSTAALDIAEFSEYFEQVSAWSAERGVFLDSREET